MLDILDKIELMGSKYVDTPMDLNVKLLTLSREVLSLSRISRLQLVLLASLCQPVVPHIGRQL